MPQKTADKIDSDKIWFRFLLIYLFIEYGRPQDYLPIGFLRPAMLVQVVLLYYIFKHRAIQKSISNQTRQIFYFILLLAALIPFATNTYWAWDATLSMLMLMPFIISTIFLIKSIERLRCLITYCIILYIYISIYSLLHGGKGSGSYFADENDVSLYIIMWLPFCYFLFMYDTDRLRKVLYVLGLITGLAAVVFSFSRGGFVGLLAVGFVIWFFSPRKVLSIFILLFIFLISYSLTSEKYRQDMSTISDTKENTANARIKSWESAIDMFLDNPLGVGGRNFPSNFDRYQGDRFRRSMWGREAHSLWFTLIPELGILGIIIYLRLIRYNFNDIISMKNSMKISNPESRYLFGLSLAFIASLAGFFSSGSFISVLYYPHYWYMTAIIVASARISSKCREFTNS